MRTASKLALLLSLALTVGANAGATTVLSLVQVGGTYDGVQAHPGDTLVLSIQYSLVYSGGVLSTTLIDPTITWGPEVTSFNGGTETGFAAWSGGAVALNPIATGDIGLIAPNVADGWEKATTISGGATTPCVFGACTSLGTATFTLSGQAGVIRFGPGTIIAPPCYFEPWFCGYYEEDAFTIVPEPATTSLIGLGLLGLALASRYRNR